METVFQYDIPVLHPLMVHFPVALILVGALAAGVWSVRGTAPWRHGTLLLMALGLAGGIAAYQTGETIEEYTEGTPIVEELVEMHEEAAWYALWVTGLATAALAGLSLWRARRPPPEDRPTDPLPVRLLVALAVLASALLIAWTAHIGGTMVWGV